MVSRMITATEDRPDPRPLARKRHCNRNQPGTRAQSEVTGVAILTGVFVLLGAILGTAAIANTLSATSDAPVVDVEANATTQYVTISHAGGETVRVEDLDVIVDGEDRIRYDLGTFVQRRGDDTARFEPGDRWRGSNDVDGDRLRLLVVHEPSNEILDTVDVTVEVTIAARFDYSPDNPVRDDTITFDASDSEVQGSSLTSYEWDFDDDGTVDATGTTAEHSFGSAGTFPVTLTVTAADGRTANTTKSVRVYNEKPDASFSVTPSNPQPGETVTMDASSSSDDGTIQSYDWTFGDGTTGSGETETHSYGTEGSYDVQLTVTDDDGATDNTTKTVTVAPQLFAVQINTSASETDVQEGETVTVAADIENTGSSSETQGISYNLTADADGSVVDSDTRSSLTLAGGEIRTVTFSYDSSSGDAGAYTATVASDDESASTGVSINRSMADDTELVTGSGSGSNDGVVTFQLRNTGASEVEIGELRVVNTGDPQASRVDNDNANEFAGGGGSLNIAGYLTIGAASATALDTNATIDSSGTETFTLQEFRRSNGQTRNMKNTQVTVELVFADGSVGTYTVNP